ncbi:MAG: formylglycine-generating enzyme family protein, partial [Verrucomicrobia bacterium]|nr:formylglycine-generating enzyme family protein [Verrucomicrobiota bacterium]
MTEHTKLFAGLLGLALTGMTAQAAAPSLSYKINGNEFIITYTGTLYQSSDAVSWTEVASASSPYVVTLGDKKLFFCAKGEEGPSENITIPLSDTVNLDMIWIEPGTFIMGSPENELGRQSNEIQHQVTLTKGYWLGKYEVTQAQYEAVMGTNPSSEWFIGADMPVNEVEWNDAKEFCQKLTEMVKAAGKLPEGYEYALPTEAQWEYACRAGTTTAFNNGTNIPSEEQLWWAQPCSNLDEVGWYCGDSDYTLHPVGQKKPNAWGLYDMHGNVFEWCSDWYGDYPTSAVTDPVGANTGSDRVYRGGAWGDTAGYCRSANRRYDIPSNSYYLSRGFRVALVPVRPIDFTDFTVTLPGDVKLEMVEIEPGTFTMGSPEDELGRNEDETPHQVKLTQGYWLGKYEVTQAQYEAVMGTNPSYFKGADLPVENVNWFDAKEFCAKLTAIEREAGRLPEGYEYTLPTEAQWEYACRAGTTTALNNGRNLSDPDNWVCPEIDEVAWYGGNSNNTHHPVGQKKPNAWRLYDMHGNVEEWCLDWHGDYPSSPVTDPMGPVTGDCRVIRGGSCDGLPCAASCRSAERYWYAPGSLYSRYLGFRVALAPLTKTKNMTIPLSEDVDLDMIWIEPDTFMMGSVSELGSNDDETWHDVTLTQGYWLGKYEVTQAQYQAIMGTNPSYIKGVDLPVEQVTWYDATNFCAKLTARERAAGRLPAGYEYTLPTEAQWEYACRAGTMTSLNSGMDLSNAEECPEMDKVGWYYYNSNDKTHPVGQKQPNNWGLYDMHGNVYEWCLDWYGDYPRSSVRDPTGPDTGDLRVLRGGGR